MKTNIFITAAILVTMIACSDSKKEEQTIQQRDSLLGVIEQRETAVNEYISYFNEVERNLDSVTAKQHILVISSGRGSDIRVTQMAKIRAEIKAINRLMALNSIKVTELHKKFKLSNNKNVELEKTIIILNNQLAMKYGELMDLNETLKVLSDELVDTRITVDTLMLRNSMQTQVITNKSNELRTAYYIVGTSTDLQQWSLVDKMGGFLGIGETAKLSNNLDMNMFTKIDYSETTVIPVNSKGIRIVTSHPTGSFSLDKSGRTVNKIVILDPEKFWSVSKYLVVVK